MWPNRTLPSRAVSPSTRGGSHVGGRWTAHSSNGIGSRGLRANMHSYRSLFAFLQVDNSRHTPTTPPLPFVPCPSQPARDLLCPTSTFTAVYLHDLPSRRLLVSPHLFVSRYSHHCFDRNIHHCSFLLLYNKPQSVQQPRSSTSPARHLADRCPRHP